MSYSMKGWIIAGLSILGASITVQAQNTAAILGFIDTNKRFEYQKPIDSLKDFDLYYLEKDFGSIQRFFNDELGQLDVTHYIININNEKGIDRVKNQLFGSYEENSLIDGEVRIFSANGKVQTLGKEVFKPSNGSKSIYKIEYPKLNVGDQVEITIGYSRSAQLYHNYVLQNQFPIVEGKFTFIYPGNLDYFLNQVGLEDNIMYNVSPDSNVRAYYYSVNNIPAIENEMYSYPWYQLKSTTISLKKHSGIQFEASNWDPFVNNFIGAQDFSISSSKNIKSFLNKQSHIANLKNDEEKAKAIEKLIKEKFTYVQADKLYESSITLDQSLKNNKITVLNELQLYKALLDHFKVKYELSFVGNRGDEPFNAYVANPNKIQTCAFYINEANAYIFPAFHGIRMGYVIPEYENTEFIHAKPAMTNTEGKYFAQFVFVNESSEDFSQSNLVGKVKVEKNKWVAEVVHTYTGHSQFFPQQYMNSLNNSKALKNFASLYTGMDSYDSLVNIKNLKHDFGAAMIDPTKEKMIAFTIESKQTIPSNAERFSIPIGIVIGKQARMEHDTNRMFNIDIDYNHIMKRTIEVEIPSGYMVENIDELNYAYVNQENNIGFTSKSVINDGKLVIDLYEHYGQMRYDKSLIEIFEKVINAAADFNDLNIVFKKQ